MSETGDVLYTVADIPEIRYDKHFSIHQDIAQCVNVYYGKTKRKSSRRNYIATPKTYTINHADTDMDLKVPAAENSCDSTALLPKDLQKRVTFLIGNGFDLNIGLNTRYQDFYKYYILKNKDDILAKDIDENYDNWSDLELGLGKYTETVLPIKEEEFWASEQNLENNLVDYLTEEVKRINLDIDDRKKHIENKMAESLLEFYKKLPDEAEKSIKRILSDAKKQYFFITFNYTDALDQCVKIIRRSRRMKSEGEEDVLHIHGTISGNMVLGVNDESQIANPKFRNKYEYKRLLIKRYINEYCGRENIKKARDIIDGSTIICIYGMSIGATDKMWWQYIGKWLQGCSDRRLVIFAKDSTVYKVKKYSGNYGEKVKDQFKNVGGLANVWNKIKNKIYVEVNADMFDFKVV